MYLYSILGTNCSLRNVRKSVPNCPADCICCAKIFAHIRYTLLKRIITDQYFTHRYVSGRGAIKNVFCFSLCPYIARNHISVRLLPPDVFFSPRGCQFGEQFLRKQQELTRIMKYIGQLYSYLIAPKRAPLLTNAELVPDYALAIPAQCVEERSRIG